MWSEEGETHPAYARILDELAPDEARILLLLLRGGPQPSVDVRTGGPVGLVSSALVAPGMSMIGARAGCRYLDEVPAYLNNLFRLGLIWFSREQLEDPMEYQVVEAQPDVLEAMHSVRFPKVVRRSHPPDAVRGRASAGLPGRPRGDRASCRRTRSPRSGRRDRAGGGRTPTDLGRLVSEALLRMALFRIALFRMALFRIAFWVGALALAAVAAGATTPTDRTAIRRAAKRVLTRMRILLICDSLVVLEGCVRSIRRASVRAMAIRVIYFARVRNIRTELSEAAQPGLGGLDGSGSDLTGGREVSVNIEPCGSRGAYVTLPPCASARARTTNRPRPVPRARLPGAREYSWNSRGRKASGTPGPLSSTAMLTCEPAA